MVEQHGAVAHRDDIVMEHACIDGIRVLLSEDGLRFGKPVLAGHRLASFQGLSGGIALGFAIAATHVTKRLSAIDKQVNAGITVFAAKAGVIGCTFIGKGWSGGQHRVMGEVLFIAEDRVQHPAGGLRFQVAVKARLQVGGRKVHSAIRCVDAGGNRACVSGPHAGGRTYRPQ